MPAFASLLLAILAILAMPLGLARAQDTPAAGSFINPFPENDTYKIQIWGDGMAEGLLGGLVELMASEPRVQVARRHRAFSSLLKTEIADEIKTLEADLARETPHIVVMMLGPGDRVPVRLAGGKRANVGSDEWKAEYTRRLDLVLRAFRKKSIGAYWVGLPIMRRQEVSDDAEMINELLRERAFVNGVKFIDIFASFADDDKSYNSYGPDLAGKNRLLREQDGVHFTQAGYRKLAHFVEREVKRDIAQARSERTIPLAGAEAEQKKIRPQQVKLAPVAVPGQKAVTPGIPGKATAVPGAIGAPRTGSGPADGAGQGDIRADNSRISMKTVVQGREESVTLDILRPSIPAAVLAALTRRETTDKASVIGDPVMTEINGGMTVVSTVTFLGETGPGDRRKQSTTTSPYYRVLVRGEALPAKPGRADDMPWPRPEMIQTPASAAPARADPAPAAPAPNRGRPAKAAPPKSQPRG